jgi:hypothetical protein
MAEVFHAHESSVGTKKPHLSGAVRPLLEAFLRRRNEEVMLERTDGQGGRGSRQNKDSATQKILNSTAIERI